MSVVGLEERTTTTTAESESAAGPNKGSNPGIRGKKRFKTTSLGMALMLAPVAIFYLMFFIWPLLTVALRSFNSDGKAQLSNFSFDNYSAVFADDYLLQIEGRTVLLAINSTIITVLLAFPTAYFISRLKRKTASLMLLLILVPFWISIVVRLFAVTFILSPVGPVNQLSQAMGFGERVLLYTQPGALVGTVMYLLPYMILILYSGMVAVDPNVMLAAKTMGASPSRSFFGVYLPMIRSSIVSGALLIFILSLSFFLVPAILGGPREQTISVYIQQQIDIYKWGTASALGVILLIATVICYVGVVRLTGSFAVGVGNVQAKGVSAENKFRWSPMMIVSAIFTTVTLALLVIPVLFVFPLSVGETGTVVFPPRGFTLKWFGEIFNGDFWMASAMRSLVVAIGAAIISVAIALILSRLLSQMRSKGGKAVIGAMAFAPIITPAILLAIGLYDVELRMKLTGTVLGLILAHVVVSMPLAFALISSAMEGVDRGTEEAAWTLGASRTKSFWSIVVRGIIPSITGAFAIAFVTSWDEVVLALFLQTGPTKTLPVAIYKYLESGIVPTVPAVASLMVTLVLVVVALRAIVSRVRSSRSHA